MVYLLPEDGRVTAKQVGINKDLYSYVFTCAYVGFVKENFSQTARNSSLVCLLHSGHCTYDPLVSQPQTRQVARQDWRCSDVTNTCPLPCLRLPAKATEFQVSDRLYCDSCQSYDCVLLQWPSHKEVSHPLAMRATARPQQLPPSHLVSRLTGTLRLNGLAVAGNWSPTKSGKLESSLTVRITPYAM